MRIECCQRDQAVMWATGSDCKYRWSLLDRLLLISCGAFLFLTGQGPVMVHGLGVGTSATGNIYFLFGCCHDFLFSCQCLNMVCFTFFFLFFFLPPSLPPFLSYWSCLVFSKLFGPLVWSLSLCLKNPSVYFSFPFLSFVSFWDSNNMWIDMVPQLFKTSF